LRFENNQHSLAMRFKSDQAQWLVETITALKPTSTSQRDMGTFTTSFEAKFSDFDGFWQSEELDALREFGLLTV